jgi:hypothetical protein
MENQERKEERLLDELEVMYQRVAASEKSEVDSMQKDALQTYYESLQISPDAPLERIKESYKRLVAFWQPAQSAKTAPLRLEAERKLAEITHAYEKILAARQRKTRVPSVKPPQKISEAPDRPTPGEEMGYRFPWSQILLGGSAFIAILLAAFFWPTLYQYATLPSGDRMYQIRTNRLTGSMTYFDGAKWNNLPFPVALPSGPQALQPLAPPASAPTQSEGQPIAAPPTKIAPTPLQPAEAKGYAIQVSAVRDLNRAKEFVESQKKSGQEFHLAKITTRDRGVFYRIYLGHFASRAEAARYMQEKKIKESFPECFIQRLSG